MEKIVVIGSSGAGKSTFAQALGDILGIEVVHLDRHFWRPDWKEHPRNIRLEIQQELLKKKDRWIIEGTYLGSSDDRLNAADTIIFLDMPWVLCLWRVIVRHMAASSMPVRLDIPEGCRDRVTFRSLLKVVFFPIRGRRQLLKKINGIRMREDEYFKHKFFLRYKTGKDAYCFLEKLSVRQRGKCPDCSRNLVYMPELALRIQPQQDVDPASLDSAKGGGAEYYPAFSHSLLFGEQVALSNVGPFVAVSQAQKESQAYLY